MTIRSKFLLIFLLVAVVPLTILASVLLHSAQTALTAKSEDNLRTIAALKEAQINTTLTNYREQVMFVSKRARLLSLMEDYLKTKSEASQRQLDQLLVAVEQVPEAVRTVSVLTMDGTVISSTDSSQLRQKRSTDLPDLSLIQADNGSADVRLTAPIMQGNTPIGYVEFMDHAPQINTILHDYIGLGATGDVFFVQQTNDNKLIISAGRSSLTPAEQASLHQVFNVPVITHALDQGSRQAQVIASDPELLVTTRHIPAIDTTLVVKINTSEAFQAVNQLRDNILIFSLIFCLLIIMVILVFVHSITSPIANLAGVAKKITKGDLNERALVITHDEIGELAQATNKMLDDLQASKNTLEKKVHERTQQLEATNKELESFSYSVSHDLRAPLRAIDGFSKILIEDYATKIDDEGRRVIQTIINSTHHMGQLIDDLLALSRLGRQDVKRQQVDMAAQAQEVFQEQMRLNPDRKLKLQMKTPLPMAAVDASLLRQVWTNLFSNAIKFTRHSSAPHIEVGFTPHKDSTTYFVKDNGAGFDMTYVDKLFGVFQRLHDQKDFEGTGVGLALVKRIVTRHGGTVWAEGKVGEGATIYFTIPKEHKKE